MCYNLASLEFVFRFLRVSYLIFYINVYWLILGGFFGKFIYFIYLFLAVLRLCCRAPTFSSYGERGYSSLCCTGFSLQRLLLLWSTGSRHEGLVAPWHVGSSRTRDWTRVPCIGRRILKRCTTREVQGFFLRSDFLGEIDWEKHCFILFQDQLSHTDRVIAQKYYLKIQLI